MIHVDANLQQMGLPCYAEVGRAFLSETTSDRCLFSWQKQASSFEQVGVLDSGGDFVNSQILVCATLHQASSRTKLLDGIVARGCKLNSPLKIVRSPTLHTKCGDQWVEFQKQKKKQKWWDGGVRTERS